MKIETKHRVIGLLVILALGAIFIPLLFSESNLLTAKLVLSSHMPTPPALPDVNLQPPTEAQVVSSVTLPVLPDAWVIELGLFSSPSSEALVERLRAAGFDAYSRSDVKEGQTALRVFVGPEINKHVLEAQNEQLKKTFKLDGTLKPYTVQSSIS
ncbi:MAG TPA: SPOR domain-containing protein [Coxiellaceae bacterium]|nr:SPOR domain-containing protein [Coxiellaceae bacterium]